MTPVVDFHSHDVSIDVALDFIDTLEYVGVTGEPSEHLNQPTDAVEWFRNHGLLHAGPPDPAVEQLLADGPEAARALDHIVQVRAALREVVDATYEDRSPSSDAIALVNQALRAHQHLRLVPDPDGCSLDHIHEGDPLDDVLARIADRIVRQVTGDQAERIRVCANDKCRWVFFDSSRTGRRRWCDMATCGNRAKAARHRARTKEAGEADQVEERISVHA